jgi:hypothetical protein
MKQRTDPQRPHVAGRTLRWTFEDGPTAGKTFQHAFGADGTVRYGMDGGASSGTARYVFAPVGDHVGVVSYLGAAGYTLTSVLDFSAGTVVAVASNESEVVLQHGRFRVAQRVAAGPAP